MPEHFSPPLDKLLADALAGEPGQYSVAVKVLTDGRTWLYQPARLRSASLIKIFILIEAFRQAAAGRLDFTGRGVVTAANRVGGAGPLQDAPFNTEIAWQEVIELMITESDNTATNMLLDRLGMAAVNATIGRLGCRDTVLGRRMMDFDSAAAGRENYTSPADIAATLEKLHFGRCLDPAADQAMLAILERQQDRSMIPQLLPAGTVVANKTGELDDGVEHDAGLVYGPSGPYILVTMTDRLPDNAAGVAAIARLSRTVFDHLNSI